MGGWESGAQQLQRRPCPNSAHRGRLPCPPQRGTVLLMAARGVCWAGLAQGGLTPGAAALGRVPGLLAVPGSAPPRLPPAVYLGKALLDREGLLFLLGAKWSRRGGCPVLVGFVTALEGRDREAQWCIQRVLPGPC